MVLFCTGHTRYFADWNRLISANLHSNTISDFHIMVVAIALADAFILAQAHQFWTLFASEFSGSLFHISSATIHFSKIVQESFTSILTKLYIFNFVTYLIWPFLKSSVQALKPRGTFSSEASQPLATTRPSSGIPQSNHLQ